MQNVLILGAGRVGTLTASLFVNSGDYTIHLADKAIPQHKPKLEQHANNLKYVELDVTDKASLSSYITDNKIKAVVSCLPFFFNIDVAHLAKALNINYFDLTEDVKTTDEIEKIAKDANSIFGPQCGLAPGFISIIANELMKDFDSVDDVRMRVGALPLNVTNSLQYGLTWSTEGIVNEYAQPCKGIVDGDIKTLDPLQDEETIKIDGITYEAFNTSGGVGSMIQTYLGKVKNMTYKSVRYPGHGEKMRFLMNDMKLGDDLPQMCKIMDKAVPRITQDTVLIYVSVAGEINGQTAERNYAQKFPSQVLFGQRFSALALTTATSLCVTIDLALSDKKFGPGFLKQEQISIPMFYANRFGHYYKNDGLLNQAI